MLEEEVLRTRPDIISDTSRHLHCAQSFFYFLPTISMLATRIAMAAATIGVAVVPFVASAQVYDPTYSPTLPVMQPSVQSENTQIDSSIFAQMMMGLSEQYPGYYQEKILKTFENSGARNPFTYDNTSLDKSSFDFQAFVSHRCFSILSEYDQLWCSIQFGPYGNLRDLLFSGKLATMLVASGIIDVNKADIVAAVAVDVQRREQADANMKLDENGNVNLSNMNLNRDDRSRAIWESCSNLFPMEGDRAACFQRSDRLLLDADLTIMGNVH